MLEFEARVQFIFGLIIFLFIFDYGVGEGGRHAGICGIDIGSSFRILTLRLQVLPLYADLMINGSLIAECSDWSGEYRSWGIQRIFTASKEQYLHADRFY